jgi:putative acetyltransferase
MSVIITLERPDSADVLVLIAELEAHLDPLYPSESRHGYSVEVDCGGSGVFYAPL